MISQYVTTKGYKVFGCFKSYNPKAAYSAGTSGRLRVVKGDPSQDEMLKWDDRGKAIEHEYGNLVNKTHEVEDLELVARGRSIFW